MHRIDTSTATSDGLFTEGDPLVPTPATVVSADWLNAVQEELVNTLSAAGIAPDKADNAQLAAALSALVLSKVDGKTTQADAGGVITVKDVAIGGDLEDLASKRGFFYDKYVPWYAGTPEDTYLLTDFNEFKKPGRYHIRWREGTDAEGGVVTQNNPNASNGGSYWYDGIMEIDPVSSCSYVSNYTRLIQRLIVTTIHNGQACRIFTRRYIYNTSTGEYWEAWKTFTFDSDFGDGLRITNYKISVPEYEGATASTTGTSGLVPPAAAGQQESFLTGGGEYKPVKSMPSGAVIPFAKVNLGGPDNRTPIFWGQSEPDTGWLICDGGSDGRGGSVPDLRKKFIMGANGVGDAGQTGGATSATPTISVKNASTGVKTQGTTLTTSTIANHAHRLNLQQYKFGGDGIANYGFDSSLPTVTPLGDRIENTGGSNSHAHGVTDPTHTHTATASEISITPPFYKLVYCIKLPET